jgi:hypothetical protein
MTKRVRRWVAIITVVAFAHMGCYNTYFISKDELEKLESGVEVQEVVTVQADCETSGSVAAEDQEGPKLAQAGSESGETATDAAPAGAAEKGKSGGEAGDSKPSGCTKVPVSTGNAINVVTNNGESRRVTPFNFMMSEQQLVSPEYDLLMALDSVKGAKVREFSTWKTVGTIAGVSAVTIGTFVGLSLTSEDPEF